jgi:hypothetical protein
MEVAELDRELKGPTIPPELLNQLERQARDEKISIADFIRAAALGFLELPQPKRDMLIVRATTGIHLTTSTLAATKKSGPDEESK